MYSRIEGSANELDGFGYSSNLFLTCLFFLIFVVRVVCEWNLDSTEAPTAILVTPLSPSSLCVPCRNLIVCGTNEGSLLIWDLRYISVLPAVLLSHSQL